MPSKTRLLVATAALLIVGATTVFFGHRGTPGHDTDTSSSTARIASSFEDLYRSAQLGSVSDFEKQAFDASLASGEISQESYQQGIALYVDCMSQAGWSLARTEHSDGVTELQPEGVREADADALLESDESCRSTTAGSIISLYELRITNPELWLDGPTAVTDCLVRSGVAGPDFTRSEYVSLMSNAYVNPSNLDLRDERAQACFYALGVAAGTP